MIEEHQLLSQYRKLSPEEKPFVQKLIEIFQSVNEQNKVAVKSNIDSFHLGKDIVARAQAAASKGTSYIISIHKIK